MHPAAEIKDCVYKETSSPLLFHHFYLLCLKIPDTVLRYCWNTTQNLFCKQDSFAEDHWRGRGDEVIIKSYRVGFKTDQMVPNKRQEHSEE